MTDRTPSDTAPTGAAYDVRALDEATWPGFVDLVERTGGMVAGCWCMAFHPESAGRGEAPVNQDRKLDRVRSRRAHAALVFNGDQCVGWCQFGPVEELPRIKGRAAYDKTLVVLPDWRIGCCFVGKGYRRQGVAAVALAGAITMIGRLGGGVVEGYPESAGSVPAGFLFNGALSTYEQAGFSPDRQIGKHRWVVRRVVEDQRPTPPSSPK